MTLPGSVKLTLLVLLILAAGLGQFACNRSTAQPTNASPSGIPTPTAIQVSVAPAIMRQLPRYFEANGKVRQALSVMKKRKGGHERTIREMRVGPGGVHIGRPLNEFQGVLTGVPTFTGPNEQMLESNGRD